MPLPVQRFAIAGEDPHQLVDVRDHLVGGGAAKGPGWQAGPQLDHRLPAGGQSCDDNALVIVRERAAASGQFAARLPAGSTGTAAIFTEEAKAAHLIRKVLLRQVAITNYVNPF